jgi:pyrrolidone-carboxylate peptidase
MISGFSDITYDLNDYEVKTLLPTIVAKLSNNKGKQRAATNKKICEYLGSRGFKASEPRVRKIINLIRNENIIPGLIATSAGYYVTDDVEELEKYVESLAQRSSEIERVRKSFLNYIQILKAS